MPRKIEHLQQLPQIKKHERWKVQIAIITATKEEFESVKNLISEGHFLAESDNDAHAYYAGFFRKNQKELSVILSRTLHQGPSAASTLTTKIIWKYKPLFIAMIGHAAGNKRTVQQLKIGDIMVSSFAVEYDQLVIASKKDGDNLEYFEKENKHIIAADSILIHKIENFASQPDVLENIRKSYAEYCLFNEKLSQFIGKIITGNSLIRDEEWFAKKADENAGSIGLDMEIHGFYYSAQNTLFKNKPLFIAIKSASDFGGSSKSIPNKRTTQLGLGMRLIHALIFSTNLQSNTFRYNFSHWLNLFRNLIQTVWAYGFLRRSEPRSTAQNNKGRIHAAAS